jgi:hypothetical protein
MMKEAPNAWRPSPPVPRSARPDIPPDAWPFLSKATTPHAHLSLLKGEALTTAPGADRLLASDPRRRTAESWFIGPKNVPLSMYQGTSA